MNTFRMYLTREQGWEPAPRANEQDFLPLFHAGDRVAVDGDRLRLLDAPAPSQ